MSVEVVPGLDHGAFVSIIGVICLAICGIYRFIVRTFNEFYGQAGTCHAVNDWYTLCLGLFFSCFYPDVYSFMFGFMMFGWVWFSRAIIRFVIKGALQSGLGRKRIAIYGAGYAGQQIAAALFRSDEHLPVFL